MKHDTATVAAPKLAGQITLDVQDVSDAMYLRSVLINGSFRRGRQKITFTVDTLVGNGSPLLRVDGKQYLVSMAKLAEAMLDLHAKATNTKGGK